MNRSKLTRPDAPIARQATRRRGRDREKNQTIGRLPGPLTYTILIMWFGTVSIAIPAGAFESGGQLPLPLITSVAAPITTVVIGYGASSRFRRYVLSFDLRFVLAAQLWRVVGIAFLFALAFDRLPPGFAVPAAVGDLATGVAALGVVLALGNGTLTRGRLYAFTALGVGDLIVAILAGVLLRPPALDMWPLIIFPTFMVPAFAILHVVAVLQSRHSWEDRLNTYKIKATGPTSEE